MRRGAGIAAAVVTAAAMTGAWAGPALAATETASPAAASRVAALIKEKGFGGYFVTLSKTATSMTAQTVLTVPRTTCGKGSYEPAVSTNYAVGKSTVGAVLELELGCSAKTYGDAILSIGSKLKTVDHPLKPGAKVTLTVTIAKSATTVSIAYSKKSVVSLKGKGGKPSGVLFGAVLSAPPKYSPMKFTSTTVNKKALGAYKPTGFEAVTKAGKLDGKPSAITGKGKNFSISY